MIHSQLFLFLIELFLTASILCDGKVILVSEIVFQHKNMKSAGLWVIATFGFHYSNAHSNVRVRWPFKTEHLAFKAGVTRVTTFMTLWFGVKRPGMCNIVTILSSRPLL